MQNAKRAVMRLHEGRPAGYEDYAITVPNEPDTIFIVKPGVTLD